MPSSIKKKKKKVRRQPYQERRQGGLGRKEISAGQTNRTKRRPHVPSCSDSHPLGLDVLRANP